MTQEQVIVLCLRTGLITGLAALVAWVAVYTYLTRGAAWKDPIGQTLIAKTLLIAGLFVPSILSLFFHMSRFGSHIVAWIDVTLIGLVTPVMIWRSIVFVHESRKGRETGRDQGEVPQ